MNEDTTNTQELGTWKQQNKGTEHKEQGTPNDKKPPFQNTSGTEGSRRV